MRLLLATTSLTPMLLLAAPAAAQRVIDTAVTTPVATATANNGAPADIRVTSSGSVNPPSGTAITLNSANNVELGGTVKITGQNGATGIATAAGGSGNITVTGTGTITLDEDYTPADADKDGDLDGAFAQGSNRFGIRTADGAAFTGAISNGGKIMVEGNQSGGIRVGGPLTGSLTNSGTIGVIGNDSVGIAAGPVSGNVRVTGAVTVQGANAVGVALDGDVGGSVSIQGAVTTTGYRATTAPSDTSKLDADDLLQGGPAVRIAGNVGGGILLDAPPADTKPDDADEDDDGVADASEGTAAIASFGSAPALQVGAANRDIAIGAVAGDSGGHGLVNKGSIAASGVYAGVDATALRVGGLGGAVDLAGGMRLGGRITAESRANATAVRIGSGASVDELLVSGAIAAGGGTGNGHVSAGIAIDAGASVPVLRNSGTIGSVTRENGTAVGILDASGTLSLIENSGGIGGTGVGVDSGRAVAIDLRANGSGATVRQLVAAQGAAAPAISGNILFGSGSDVLEVADGSVTGNISFGAGSNRMALSGDAKHAGKISFGAGADQLTLAGTSQLAGDIDFGGGADVLTMATGTAVRGAFANSSGVTVNVGGGTLDVTNTGPVALASLAVGEGGSIGVTIDAETGSATRYQVAGVASFGANTKVLVGLDSVSGSEGDFVIVQAGTLTEGGNLSAVTASLPYLFKGSVSSDANANTVTLSIDRKTAAELGLNRALGSAYGAIFEVLDEDERIADTILAIDNGEELVRRFSTFLPQQSGSAFENVTQASRAAARVLADPTGRFLDRNGWSLWLQQVAWGSSKDLGDTGAYDLAGWGVNGGGEVSIGAGRLGGSLAYLQGTDKDGMNDNETLIGQYEAAVHWRLQSGGFGAIARGSVARLDFTGKRRFDGGENTAGFSRVAKAEWNGMLYSLAGTLQYELALGKRLRVRPIAAVDYYKLTEDAHQESGGGAAFDLTVDERESDELAATGSVAIGYELGSLSPDETWLRLEIEGGRREVLSGSLGATTARFGDGAPFVLAPEERDGGWIGRLRLSGGQDAFVVGGEASAEELQGHAAIAFRLNFQAGW